VWPIKAEILKTIKLHSSVPYFFLAGLFGLIPVLNNKYPARFFPGFSPGGVEVLSTFAGIAAATLGFMRLWARLEKGARAKALVLEAAASRHPADQPLDNDLATVARFISRLVRNVDEDLREIGPDFSQNSLSRLEKFLPALLREIESREDALIRLGVAGVYLGEAACRNFQWQWHFKADPALHQFGYLASIIQRRGKNLDPYAWAADLMAGKGKMADFIKEIK
jgi:hypothetical protein